MAFTNVNGADHRSVTSGQTSWTLTAGTIGDLRVIMSNTFSSTLGISALSGGGVSHWSQAVVQSDATQNRTVEIWYGPITSTGTTLTLAYSGTIGSTQIQQDRLDFRNGGVFRVVDQGSNANDVGSTSLTWPSLNADQSGELFVGVARVGGSPAIAGSTPGYSYIINPSGAADIYALDLPKGSTTPTCTSTSTGRWMTLGVIFSSTDYDTAMGVESGAVTVSVSSSDTSTGIETDSTATGVKVFWTDADTSTSVDSQSAVSATLVGNSNLLPTSTSGMESGMGPWIAGALSNALATYTSNLHAHSGTYSLQAQQNTSVPPGSMVQFSPGTLGVTSQDTYLVSFWVYTGVVGSQVAFHVDWYQSDLTTLVSTSGYQGITTAVASTWTYVSAVVSSPANASELRLFLDLYSGGSNGSLYYFDDVSITDDSATDFVQGVDAGRLTMGQTDTSSAAVDNQSLLVNVHSSDSISGRDSGGITSYRNDADTSSATEAQSYSVLISASDTSTGVEASSTAATLHTSETATGLDTGSLVVNLADLDRVASVDSGSTPGGGLINSQDLAHSADFQSVARTYTTADTDAESDAIVLNKTTPHVLFVNTYNVRVGV